MSQSDGWTAAGQVGKLRRVGRAVFLALVAAVLSMSLVAHEAVAADKEHPGGKDSLGEIGQKLSNPVSNVWAMFTEFDFAFNGGTSTGGSGDKTQQAMIFQPIMPIQLTDTWKMITRPTLPVIMNQDVPQSPIPGGNGTYNFNNFGGLGDFSMPLMLAPDAGLFKLGSGEVVAGFGPSFIFPTSTSDEFGDQQYQVGLAALGVWKNKKITIGALTQWWWGVGWRSSSDPGMGIDPGANHGSVLYFFFYELGNAWQVGFNPTITINPEASSGNRANVPLGVTVAKTIKVGGTPLKIQLGVEYSVLSEDFYGKRTMIRLNLIPVIPPLIKNPLF